jgi:prepilin-type N-terminal cleavage/methylation domain-containing protein
MKYSSATDKSGFTLIEVIVAIVLVASLSGMMIVFLSDSLVKSSQSIGRLKKVSDLNKVMQNIIQYYNQYPKWRSGITYAVNDRVVPTKRNGKYYVCTQGGTSYSYEPDWTTSPPIPDGVVVMWNEGAPPLRNLSALKDPGTGYIGAENTDQNNAYGKYHVVKNGYVKFVPHTELDDTGCVSNCILKVTLKSDQGETLTALFF